jgi:hypothetical protein
MTVVDSASIAPTEEVLETADALRRNGFEVHVVPTAEAAHTLATSLVPRGAEVFTATSVTLDETGLSTTFNGGDYAGIRSTLTSLAGDPANKKEMKRLISAVDYVVSSVHAVTRDGKLLVASATGSQLGIQAYGADKVLFVIGTQKVSPILPMPDPARDRRFRNRLNTRSGRGSGGAPTLTIVPSRASRER